MTKVEKIYQRLPFAFIKFVKIHTGRTPHHRYIRMLMGLNQLYSSPYPSMGSYTLGTPLAFRADGESICDRNVCIPEQVVLFPYLLTV